MSTAGTGARTDAGLEPEGSRRARPPWRAVGGSGVGLPQEASAQGWKRARRHLHETNGGIVEAHATPTGSTKQVFFKAGSVHMAALASRRVTHARLTGDVLV